MFAIRSVLACHVRCREFDAAVAMYEAVVVGSAPWRNRALPPGVVGRPRAQMVWWGWPGGRVSRMQRNAPLFSCRSVRRISAGMLDVKKCLEDVKIKC